MTELKPCPFCGSSKSSIKSKSHVAGWTGIDARVDEMTFSVRCNVCHARGGTVSGKVITTLLYMYKDHMPEWATRAETLKQKAAEMWNRRADNATD